MNLFSTEISQYLPFSMLNSDYLMCAKVQEIQSLLLIIISRICLENYLFEFLKMCVYVEAKYSNNSQRVGEFLFWINEFAS